MCPLRRWGAKPSQSKDVRRPVATGLLTVAASFELVYGSLKIQRPLSMSLAKM